MENTNSLHEYLEFDDLQLSQMEPDELLKIIAMQAAIINQFDNVINDGVTQKNMVEQNILTSDNNPGESEIQSETENKAVKTTAILDAQNMYSPQNIDEICGALITEPAKIKPVDERYHICINSSYTMLEMLTDVLHFVKLIELVHNPINCAARLLSDASVLAKPALAHRPRIISKFNVQASRGIVLKITAIKPSGKKRRYKKCIRTERLTPSTLYFLRSKEFPPPPNDIIAIHRIQIDVDEMGSYPGTFQPDGLFKFFSCFARRALLSEHHFSIQSHSREYDDDEWLGTVLAFFAHIGFGAFIISINCKVPYGANQATLIGANLLKNPTVLSTKVLSLSLKFQYYDNVRVPDDIVRELLLDLENWLYWNDGKSGVERILQITFDKSPDTYALMMEFVWGLVRSYKSYKLKDGGVTSEEHRFWTLAVVIPHEKKRKQKLPKTFRIQKATHVPVPSLSLQHLPNDPVDFVEPKMDAMDVERLNDRWLNDRCAHEI